MNQYSVITPIAYKKLCFHSIAVDWIIDEEQTALDKLKTK